METKNICNLSRMVPPSYGGGLGRGSRGIRNMNPCNIRKGDKWQGMREVQTDKAFVQFKSMDMGLRAAFKTLKTYRDKYHLNSIAGIIRRWAPTEDGNNTEAYITAVEQRSGINRFAVLKGIDYMKVVKAMCWVESLYIPKDNDLTNAFYMAGTL